MGVGIEEDGAKTTPHSWQNFASTGFSTKQPEHETPEVGSSVTRCTAWSLGRDDWATLSSLVPQLSQNE